MAGNKELIEALDLIEKEKDISKEVMLEAIENSLLAACKNEFNGKVDNIHVNMDVFRAYTRGYLRSATFLTPMERSFLPYGCRRMSYMQAVRFLTDYLNGDTYYKTDYAEHNLIRTRAQIRLLEEQEFRSAEMEEACR